MPNRDWIINPDWQTLPPPSQDDKVLCKYISVFEYEARIIVTNVLEDHIEGIIEAIFDSANRGEITAGEEFSLRGQIIRVQKKYIHAVLRND